MAAADELLPGSVSSRSERRRRTDRRRRMLTVGAVVAGVLLVGAAVWAATRDGSTGGTREASPTSSTTRDLTTTSTTAPPDDSTTTTDAAAVVPQPTTVTSVPQAPGTVPDAGGSGAGGFTAALDPGSCRWDADTGELVASGTVTAGSAEDSGSADISVAWSDQTGDLDSWDELVPVDAGGTERFDVSTPWDEAPQGALSCQVTLA